MCLLFWGEDPSFHQILKGIHDPEKVASQEICTLDTLLGVSHTYFYISAARYLCVDVGLWRIHCMCS